MTRSPLARLLALTALAAGALPGCDDADPAPDAEVSTDTGAPDTTAPDTSAPDTTTTPDTSAPDTATTPDTSAPDTTTPDASEEVADTTPADTVAPSDTTAAASPLVGRWAQKQAHSSVVDVPIVGQTIATTTSVLLLDIVADGDEHVLTQTICTIDLDSGTELVSTVLPDAAVRSVQPVARRATLAPGGAVSIAGLSEVWGALLVNPETDPLPTSPSDARVIDHELDGKPGMTVRLSGLIDGEIYLVQRGFTSLEGTYDGLTRVDGLITWRQEQSILDTDNPLLKTPLASRPNPDASASWFRTTRIADDATCATVIATEAALFTR